MESMQDIVEMGQKYVMNTYARFPYAFTRGEGVYLYDMDGKSTWTLCPASRSILWDTAIKR